MHKKSDETFTIFSSKLRIAILYYLNSRQITNEFDKLVSLLCADRLKESLSKPCLDFVLAQEKGEWLGCKELAEAADIYVASHSSGNDTPHYGRSTPKYSNWTKGQTQVRVKENTPQPKFVKQEVKAGVNANPKVTQEEAKAKDLCFLCYKKGHRARECHSNSNRSAKKVDTCKVKTPTEVVYSSTTEKIGASGEKCLTVDDSRRMRALDEEDWFNSLGPLLLEPEV